MSAIEISDISAYLSLFKSRVELAGKLYRGQSKRASDPRYALIPSVGRVGNAKSVPFIEFVKDEKRSHDIFKNQVVANVSSIPRNSWEILALATSWIPTRFLDGHITLLLLYICCP